MKIKYIIAITVLLLFACSKNGNDEVRKFAIDFAAKVSQNQKDSLLTVWPDVIKADSLALSYVADSIVIEPVQTEGQFRVNFGNADMVMTMDEDGKMIVGETHGLFAYPDDVMEFAKCTGQWVAELPDTALATRLGDKDFRSFLVKDFRTKFSKMLSIQGKANGVANMGEFGYQSYINWTATVVNKSDKTIMGQDYTVTFPFIDPWTFSTFPITVNGKDIAANGTASVSCKNDYRVLDMKTPYIRIKLSDEALFEKYFQPTGNEYEEYLSSKK